MVIARKIAYNVVVSSVSKVLSTVLALVAIGLITRYLGKGGFGNYATVLAFLSFFSAVADLGLNQVSTREISRPGANEAKTIGNVFALRVVVSAIVLLLSPVVIFFFPYPLEVKQAVVIIAASFLFSSTYQVLNGVFQKNLAMDKVAVSELAGRVLQVGIIILAVQLKLGFLWIVSSLFFYMVLSFLMVFFWSKKYIRFNLRFDFDYWKNFLKESYPLGLAAIVTFVYFKMDTILLSVMKGSTDTGIYNVAYKVVENITFFPSMVVGLIFPIMSRSIFSDKKEFRQIADKTFKVFWVFVVPLIVGVLFLAEGIVGIIGGSGFSESAGILRVLVFALACIFFSNFSNAILIAGNKQKKLMFVLALAAVFNVAANLFFIPLYSYNAAAIISFATELFVAVASFRIVAKEVGYFPAARNLKGIFGAGAVMAIFLFFLRSRGFFITAILGTLVYFFFLWIFRALKTEELTSIIRRGEENTSAI